MRRERDVFTKSDLRWRRASRQPASSGALERRALGGLRGVLSALEELERDAGARDWAFFQNGDEPSSPVVACGAA